MMAYVRIALWAGIAIMLAGCGMPAGRTADAAQAASTQLPDRSPPACPITRQQAPAFQPPAPYPAQAPEPDSFWYGSDALWTLLRSDGTWRDLPHGDAGYTQKVVWWRRGYDWQADPTPRLTVTGRRLDAPAPPLAASRATNGFHESYRSFMLVGVDIPTPGCWELTGQVPAAELKFVVWVAP
jgi:hypothetical protein